MVSNMELEETIKKRKSIRKFKDTDVSDKLVEDLIKCARLAPSAKNRQPWKFIIVKNNTKNQITDIMSEKLENDKINTEKEKFNSTVKETIRIIKESPILILVFKPCDYDWMIVDTLSIGAAIENICLRATDLGLGSLIIGDIFSSREEIAKLVEHEDMELISAISIGYPDENPQRKLRKNLNEILEWK